MSWYLKDECSAIHRRVVVINHATPSGSGFLGITRLIPATPSGSSSGSGAHIKLFSKRDLTPKGSQVLKKKRKNEDRPRRGRILENELQEQLL